MPQSGYPGHLNGRESDRDQHLRGQCFRGEHDAHDLPHGIHGVLLLGDAEAPGNDGRSRPAIELAQFADFRFRDAGLQFDLLPTRWRQPICDTIRIRS